jgi:Flp pilus assembly protein TadG
MLLRKKQYRKSGVAAVEMAIVTVAFVVPLIIAIWEIGRYIQGKQIVANSAREGARLAAQGFTVLSNGTQVQINVSTGTPNVHQTVYDYLLGAGLTQLTSSQVTVDFTFTSPTSTGTYPTQPYLGQQGEAFTVYVSIPWSAVQWSNIGIINPTNVQYTVTWQMLIDSPFIINPALPSW